MKWFFAISVILVAAIMAAMPLKVQGEILWWFEGGLSLLLVALIFLRIKVISPIRAIERGVALLNEQDFSCRLSNVGQRNADSIAATFNRMIDTLKNERLRVMEQNHFLEMLIDASPAGILIMNFDGTIRNANPAARKILGTNELSGKKLDDVGTDLATKLATLRNRETATVRLGDTQVYRCSRLSFMDNGFQRPFIMIESLTKEIMKAEREAYGKVIRLIGHEVNNTVAGLVPMFETMAMIADDADLREASESCRERCESLSRFISRYAEVVKLPPPTLRTIDLSELIGSTIPFLESMASKRNIAIRFSTDGPSIVRADPVQMEQVLVNVVKNSIESIGSDGFVDIHVSAAPAGFEITDNGAGLSPEASENMFSPFFSTKEGGQGIGLTLVSEILLSHGMSFRLFTSAEDKLTHFTVKFT